MSDIIIHYGTPRHSGRYPWGSGKNPQRNKNILTRVDELKKKGFSEASIAKALEMKSTKELRAEVSLATNQLKRENILRARALKEKGYSNVKIAEMMNTGESNIRNWLKDDALTKRDSTRELADTLKGVVDRKGYIDVGKGVELELNTTSTKMDTALELLKKEGYTVTNVMVDQLGTGEGQKTLVKVLAPPGTKYKDINANQDQIHSVVDYISENERPELGKLGLPPVNSISSDRIQVRYDEEHGTDKDGVIEIRRGLEDLNLGNAHYAQVRIGVDGTHYLKGMAVYSDNMPEGVDVIFNTNKSNKKELYDVLKPMKMVENSDGTKQVDPDNPFGASIKSEEDLKYVPRYYIDSETGEKKVSPINVVNEEGDWSTWSKTLASQMLSKQPYTLAKKQLELSYDIKKSEFDSIMELDNAVVKRQLLEAFASDCDSSAVHLKAASLPRQSSHVILPVTSLKDTEIYARNYHDGEQVALIRYPHGGTFEIPILTVNNKNKEAISVLGSDPKDAVGINPRVAERLSGADFDGDTVLVIPTGGNVKIKSTPALEGLKGFDPKKEYALNRVKDADGNPTPYVIDPVTGNKIKKPAMSEHNKQIQMGIITNLITDMTIKGADFDEIARAVRHSMVIIDSEKHDLDFRQSAKDNNIKELIKSYQIQSDGSTGGASTIISRAKSTVRVPTRKEMQWNPETGERVFEDKKGDTYISNKKKWVDKEITPGQETYLGKKVYKDKKTGRSYILESTGKIERRTDKITQMEATNDARTLISDYNTSVERAYAAYANQLKGLANDARKAYSATVPPAKDPQASKIYAEEVRSLKEKLYIAQKNSPRERQAQILANTNLAIKKQGREIDSDTERKLRAQCLATARANLGAKKQLVEITEREWKAIQARAISPTTLKSILDNSNLDQVKKLATPRTSKHTLTTSQIAVIKSMKARGYAQSEIAERFGVSTSTISNITNG